MKVVAALAKSSGHVNVLRILEIIEDDECYYEVMEFCRQGDMLRHLSFFTDVKFDVSTGVRFALDIIKGIEFLHSLNICHLDLKPDNVLIGEVEDGQYVAKLADFTLSSFCGDNMVRHKMFGTLNYMAPELLQSTPMIGKPTDVWCFGCIVYEIVVG